MKLDCQRTEDLPEQPLRNRSNRWGTGATVEEQEQPLRNRSNRWGTGATVEEQEQPLRNRSNRWGTGATVDEQEQPLRNRSNRWGTGATVVILHKNTPFLTIQPSSETRQDCVRDHTDYTCSRCMMPTEVNVVDAYSGQDSPFATMCASIPSEFPVTCMADIGSRHEHKLTTAIPASHAVNQKMKDSGTGGMTTGKPLSANPVIPSSSPSSIQLWKFSKLHLKEHDLRLNCKAINT